MMKTDISSAKFTYEDYQLFPDDGRRHEIIAGDHYMTPSPMTKHQRISMKLTMAIQAYLQRSGAGELLYAPCDVVLSDVDVVQPDLLFISEGRAFIITEKNIQGAPDLVIEILSEGTRKVDEVIKRKLYERQGVAEYWVVDPELESAKVYRLVDGKYVRQEELSLENEDSLSTPLLPKLEIPLAQIFA